MKKLFFGTLLLVLAIAVSFPTMARAGVNVSISLPLPPLPPPIIFPAPPQLIVLPETYVYVAPDIAADLFFWNGWWWHLWEGRWYRSHYHNRGWGYYNRVPSFYFDVDPGWRGYYRDNNWYGNPWHYELIPQRRVQQNWRGWQNDRHWERRGSWGVQGLQPIPRQQRQELRQQRQQQYQQRPDVQKQIQPQVRQPQQSKPQVQKPQRQQQMQPQVRQPQQSKSQVQKPQGQKQIQPLARQPQQSKSKRGKPETGEEEKRNRR